MKKRREKKTLKKYNNPNNKVRFMPKEVNLIVNKRFANKVKNK